MIVLFFVHFPIPGGSSSSSPFGGGVYLSNCSNLGYELLERFKAGLRQAVKCKKSLMMLLVLIGCLSLDT